LIDEVSIVKAVSVGGLVINVNRLR
jgi:hypothetical protein